MQPDLDRMTKPEIWQAALEAGRTETSTAVESKPPILLGPRAGWREHRVSDHRSDYDLHDVGRLSYDH